MNENIDLVKILKDCPKWTKLYSTIYGDVTFYHIDKRAEYPIILKAEGEYNCSVSANGKHYIYFDGECTLFPSKDKRDWNKFSAPWYKKEKFDPMTLKPFDKTVVRKHETCKWKVDFYSHKIEDSVFPFRCIGDIYKYCIPYNDDTKHLVGTTEEVSEYYKYWKD